jgi:hypothetical protein
VDFDPPVEGKVKGDRNTGLSPLRFAPVEMTCIQG